MEQEYANLVIGKKYSVKPKYPIYVGYGKSPNCIGVIEKKTIWLEPRNQADTSIDVKLADGTTRKVSVLDYTFEEVKNG